MLAFAPDKRLRVLGTLGGRGVLGLDDLGDLAADVLELDGDLLDYVLQLAA